MAPYALPPPLDEWHNPWMWTAVNNDGGSFTRISNNIFVDAVNASFNSGGGLAWPEFGQQDNASAYYAKMRAVAWDTGLYAAAYPELAVLQDFFSTEPPCRENPRCPAAPWGNSVTGNVAFNMTAMLDPPVAAAKFPASNFDVSNNLLNVDPLFVAADPRGTLDFRLRADSPAYTQLNPPFKPIRNCFGPWASC